VNLLYAHESFGSLGGAEANVFITATEMRARGHRVGLLTSAATGKGGEAWTRLFGEDTFWLGREGVAGALGKFGPDVIYVHKWAELGSLAAILDAGPPAIRMVHDHDIYCMRSYRYNVFTRRVCHRPASPYCVFPCLAFMKRNRGPGGPFRLQSYREKLREIALCRRFDRNLVVTRYMRDELVLNGFDPDRIEIFPPVPRPGEAVRSRFSDRNLLLYAGQIIRGKGVDVLPDALARVRTPFEAVILGDGNHRSHCQRLARRLGLGARVHFKGFVPQEELRRYYEDTSVVLISSVWPEPIATIGLEVMRYALPVIAFDAGGIRDWLADGENGHLVPWMDVATYARRIEELLGDKARAKAMGLRGLERVSRDYDFDAYIQNLERLFERTAATTKGTPRHGPTTQP